jgi:flagellar FliL protein
MKKNLLSVIILALVLANLVLTAILAFSIIPQTKKSNALIDQVCTAINLDLEAGQNKDTSAISIENIETYLIEDSFTVNLKDSGDGAKHVAVFTVSLSMNKLSDGYTEIGSAGLAEKETIIQSEINTLVSNYTLEQFEENGYANVKKDILASVQSMFGGDFIVGVNFSSVMTQ